ncbi:hypothetical protein TSUD_64820 [Trifolium subterraneum]|uniref:Uncharacterized protein n=1 Tax=Trifolium subterraneum TaxID=3900 RepID=A0A2Z6PB49_TRISU|nr:hypothetical protein TSUD_64820 [Trifolium subterraneum]
MSTLDQAGSDKISIMTDVADVLEDSTLDAAVSSQGPVVSEVAIAAADSYLPVQALQYVIDAVHTYTGLDWWAAIILTTLLIRSATVPLLINQLKATSKLTLMRPRLEEIKEEMDGKEQMEYDRNLMLVVHRQLIIKKPSYEFQIAAQFREALPVLTAYFVILCRK